MTHLKILADLISTALLSYQTAKKNASCTLFTAPPSSQPDNNQWLVDLVSACPHNSIMIGDFNLPEINWSDNTASSLKGRNFLDACIERGMEQMVSFSTHIKGNTLDLVLVDRTGSVNSVAPLGRLGRSDHEILWIEVANSEKLKPEKKYVKNWRKADWNEMRVRMGERDWAAELRGLSAEESWSRLKSALQNAIEDLVPLREVRMADRPAWLSVSLLQEIRKKRKLWAALKRCPSEANKAEYKQVEKKVQKKIRNAKKRFEQRLAADNTTDKKFFSYIRAKTKSRSDVGPLKSDGKSVTGSKEIADVLNKYFGSVFQPEEEGPVPEPKEYNSTARCGGVNFRPSLVKKAIKKLKTHSAPGPDGITPRVLQELVEEVSTPLSIVFMISMESSSVPEDWRRANVTPIFKKGPKADPSNYRPVSLTSVPGKLMESVIKDSMMAHLRRSRIISGTQHGFMPHKSCTTNLLEFLETATKLVDEGRSLDIIYLDFAKAFDLVPKLRLIKKLQAHGFTGKVLKWISAWLSNRQQRVVLNGQQSSWIQVTSGVPQGSILGPILFTIFINDLDEGVDEVVKILVKFADDTKLGHAVDTDQEREAFQTALDTLCSWAETWNMRFNVDKCHVVHVGRSNKKFGYFMNGVQLTESEEERDIGVIINNKLKPSAQCERAARTAKGVLGQILRAFSYRDRTILPRLYAQYVRPHLEFGVQAWAPWQRADIDILEEVQKKMVRAVTGLTMGTYEEKCAELALPTLEERRHTLDLVQTYKIVHNVDDVQREKWFSIRQDGGGLRTRAAEGGPLLAGTVSRLEVRHNFFSQRVVDKWNRLPSATKNARNVAQFKNMLRKE